MDEMPDPKTFPGFLRTEDIGRPDGVHRIWFVNQEAADRWIAAYDKLHNDGE